MNPNWIGTLCAAGALALFFLTHRFSAQLPQRKKILFALIASIVALPGASFAFYYTHLLPETASYYEFRSWRGTELLLLPLGLAGGFIASLLPRKLLILPLFGVAAFAIVPILKPFIRPIPADTLNDRWDDAFCLQSTPSTCGAASVATIL
ncbi:MAG: peptidase bacteriocin processing, partial [Verrucomicrobia bacterium]|nr:peptidase bacteriocin processing [Verrucomicrobiota bacterium]